MELSPPISVGFVSLGCAKNLVDTQVMAGILQEDGIAFAPSPSEADVVIVNTCAFIDEAREESRATITEICDLKSSGGCSAVIVAGCMSQRYRDHLQEEFPAVDAFIGLDDLDKVAGIVRRLGSGERGIVSVSTSAERIYDPPRADMVFTGGPFAYLKIAEGCQHGCSFCAIPSIRGRHRSRSIDAIVSEAKVLLSSGFKELNLISQDTTFYGRDRSDGASLPGLLKALGSLEGGFWLRLLYGYPAHVTDELMDAMSEIDQVCRYLDIPIQHSHPEILRAMARSDTADIVPEMASRLRRAVPGISLRTTCLVGFPGEEDRHFEHLREHVKRARYDHLGVFVYSPEEGTRAESLPGRPTREEAEERREILLEDQREIVDEIGNALIGQEADVLLENPALEDHTVWAARAERQAPDVDGVTYVDGASEDWTPGMFLRAMYTDRDGYDFGAERVQVGSQ